MSSRRAFLEVSAAVLLCRRTMGLQSGIPPPLPAVRLLFAGDAMLARHVGQLARARRNPVWPWRQVEAQFTAADIAPVSMHAGNEYTPEPESPQREFARAAIDAAAKLVVGHHPHVAQAAATYRGRRLEQVRLHAIQIHATAPVFSS